MIKVFSHIKNIFCKSDKKGETMLNYDVIFARLIKNEGMVLTQYVCPAGYKTIGVGRNLDLNPLTKEEKEVIKNTKKITEAQAFMLLKHDVDKVCKQLDESLPWWRNLDSERQYVMIDLCFNMGISKLLGFKNTLAYIAKGSYEQAADNLLKSKYASQVKNRGLRNANCLRTGKYE